MTPAKVNRIKNKISTVLQSHVGIPPSTTMTLLPQKSLEGKLYEAYILAEICETLVLKEKCQLKLITKNNKLMLKQKGGPINRNYPYFEVFKNGVLDCEIMTDIEFTTLSHSFKGLGSKLTNGDYHELDIAVLEPNCTGRPDYNQVLAAVECKNTSLKKSIIRELLGFRRELSYYADDNSLQTNFPNWKNTTHSFPTSVHLLYCSDKLYRIARYRDNCFHFGIFLEHKKM